MKTNRGFRGQLKLNITKLERQKEKLEHRVQKMVKDLVLIDNLIVAMNAARNPEAVTPAVEAAQVAEGTEQANASLDAAIQENTIKEAIANANPIEELKIDLAEPVRATDLPPAAQL